MSERWTHALLVVLLLGHLFLLATGARSRGSRLERLMLASLGPISHATSGVAEGVSGVFDSFRLARSLREENQRLHREVELMRHELARLMGVAEKLERLSRTTGDSPPETGDVIVADVVFIDHVSWLRTLVLYTGTVAPRRNQPVFTDRGLVGRVVVPAGRYAKVLLITDPSSSVSAMIARTRQRGMVRGAGEGRLELENILHQADVRLDDQVLTAGIDGVFPRGIPIGRVKAIEPGQGLFQRIEVVPAIDYGLLDQVYVLTREALPVEIREALSQGNSSDATP
ncbi:MAG: rod shape-determining protein MreC [bacterium]|nr:rod shape-determining protein MreC [bacterium]